MTFSLAHYQINTMLKYILIATAIVLISGCTTVGDRSITRAYSPVIVDGLDVSFMGAVIKQGFEEIRERALYEPSINELFAGALDELGSIGEEASFSIKAGRIFLRIGEDLPIDLGKAPKDDLPLWSRAMIDVVLAARRESEPFHQAEPEDFYTAMFNGALSRLDEFSRYADRENAARNRLLRDGVIGLGIRVIKADDGALVQSIVKDGPAAEVGILIGDMIITANGIMLAEKSLPDIRRSLEGRSEGPITLTIKRKGELELLTIKAQRKLVVPDTVTSQVVNGVAELHIKSFNQRTALAVEDALFEAKDEAASGLRGLILDLRGDPGGLLNQAIKVADLFLEHGSITQLHGRHPRSNQSYKAVRGDIADGLPIVIIVDGRAASAAEILTAALQDNHRAIVIGTVTLGKGSVQTIIRLPNNGEISLTWSRAAAPSGVGLHGLGILPDICLSGEISPAGEVISHLFISPNPMVAARPQWLNPPRGSDEEVISLRRECPAEMRTNVALDIEVARRIVSDPELLRVVTPDRGAQIAIKP
ncbi:MAG TPA: hypothetical protein DGZ24_06700 [Rhodospirillaceae bacterium]|nr:hypothetical protein [Rhodospirillaceae bacterium]